MLNNQRTTQAIADFIRSKTMSDNRDSFFDDGIPDSVEEKQDDLPPPIPAARKSLSSEVKPNEMTEDPTMTPRSPSPRAAPPPAPVSAQPETIPEEIHESRASSRTSSKSDSFESDIDSEEEEEEQKKDKILLTTKETPDKPVLTHSTADKDSQTDRVTVYDREIQTEATDEKPLLRTIPRKLAIRTKTKTVGTPLVKTLFDENISSALPIISFCQPFSMTSHVNDIILAMPRHIMIINNQNSVSVFPWQQPHESTSTILECFWCPFLYKLLVTTVEDHRLFIYDFISIIDSIKLRGYPLSIKHQNRQSTLSNSSSLLPASSRHQPLPAMWSQTRFTKSNSLGIYYCYISDRHHSTMLTRIDHNTRLHVKAIDCSGGSLNNNARVCAMGLSDERVAVVMTNLIMTLYDAKTLLGLRQINVSYWNGLSVRGVSALMYLWKTWVLFDPIDNKAVGIGNRKRRFVKTLPEHPTNACSMDNGTLALWLGYPGALFYYRLAE